MNVKPAEADRFLAQPPLHVRGVLLYGPDSGLVDERGRGLVRLVAETPDDPFRVVELTRRDVESDPPRLADELAALSFTGGRRVVRLRDAGDSLAGTVDSAMESGSDGFLIVEAGELQARSALRKLFESEEALAAIACYRDDERSLPAVIRSTLEAHGLAVARDAVEFLSRNLGGDRQLTRRELEKLALYVTGNGAADPAAGRTVTLEDAETCVGDSAEITQEDLAFAVAGSDLKAVERAFARATAEGVAAISLVRAVARHFQRLHQVQAGVEQGQPLETQVGRLRPPVFWKRRKAFEAQARRWTASRLREALADLTELEIACKSGTAGQDLLAGRTLLRLAANAPRPRA